MDDEARQGYVKAGKIASRVREEAVPMIKEGALLLDIAEFVETEIERLGGRSAFPVNIAIDNVAAHYTPHSKDTKRFKIGQLVKLDLGVHVDGYIADTAVSVEVASKSWQELIGASSMALDLVIEMIKPGVLARDIGGLVERTIVSKGFVPVSNLSGHRLRKFNLHAGISIPNIGDDSMDMVKEGMALAVEPFATNGAGRVAGRKSGNIFRLVRKRSFGDKVLDSLVTAMDEEFRGLPFSERWVAKQVDRSDKKLRKLLRLGTVATYPILSDVKGGIVSQTEHTLLITDRGCLVTTR